MEENRKILPFTDDEGNTIDLEIVDSFEMDDKKYAILVEPETEDGDDEGLVYIMEIQSDDEEEMILIEIEEDEINAKFDGGTLTIVIPKKQEIETKKQIEIE